MTGSLLLLAQAAAGVTMDMPQFLDGCWEQRREQEWTEECWTGARGGLMIGSGRAGRDDSVRSWEWMRIERASDGSLSFYGSPKGAPAVQFKAKAANANSITFANAAHDFPQRIAYVLRGDRLEAEISLVDGKKPIRWTYVRKTP